MESSIDFNGKKLISAKRASEITDYSSDYIGQLCRAKKITSTLFGRSWFVSLEELQEYKKLLHDDLPLQKEKITKITNRKSLPNKKGVDSSASNYKEISIIIPPSLETVANTKSRISEKIVNTKYEPDSKPLLPELTRPFDAESLRSVALSSVEESVRRAKKNHGMGKLLVGVSLVTMIALFALRADKVADLHLTKLIPNISNRTGKELSYLYNPYYENLARYYSRIKLERNLASPIFAFSGLGDISEIVVGWGADLFSPWFEDKSVNVFVENSAPIAKPSQALTYTQPTSDKSYIAYVDKKVEELKNLFLTSTGVPTVNRYYITSQNDRIVDLIGRSSGSNSSGGGTSNVAQLGDLTDVSLGSTTYGDLLMYDGTDWVNTATSSLGITGGTVIGNNFSWPFTPQTWGVSTSTTLGLLNGFLSTASSTIVGDATTTGMFSVGTRLHVSDTGFGTTTLSGLNISGQATTTSNVGFNITTGCFAVNGTCVGGGSGGSSASSTLLADSNTWGGPNVFTGLLSNTYASSTYSSFATASTTNLLIGSSSFNSLLGSGLSNSAGTLTVSGLTTSNFTSANISQWTNNAGYQTFLFPFTANTGYNSTSTVIGFTGGLFSTASSTFSSSLYLPSLSQGSLYVGSSGLVNTTSTTTASCAGSSSCSAFTVFGSSPVTITGTGLSSYDAWTHPSYGGSATTSLLTLSGGFLSTASSTIVGQTNLIGDVGIGTSSPSAKLSVKSNGTSSSGRAFVISDSANTEKFTVLDDGTVGIGGADPNIVLNIRSNASSLLALDSSGGGGPVLTFKESGVNKFFIGKSAGVSGSGLTAYDFYPASGNGLAFYTNTAARMYISTGGFIGFGTTTPTYRVNPFSSTAPQLALSAGVGLNQWTFRNAGGDLYLSTTTVAGDATTTTSALEISGSGFGTTTVRGLNISAQATTTSNVGFNITNGCFAVNGTCLGGSSYGDSNVNAYIHASTTIPKTYTTNTWTNTNSIASTLFNVTGLSDGCVEMSSGFLTSTGSNCGSGSGGITSIGAFGQQLTASSQLFATSTNTTNGLTSALTIVSSGSTHTFTPSISGTLTAGGGGTGISNPSVAGILLGSYGGGSWQQVATSSLRIAASDLNNDAGFITSASIFAWPFTAQTWGVSTTTRVGFLGGLNASSTSILDNASTTMLSVSSHSYFPSGIWNSSGNVGIGTTNPLTKLHISDSGGAVVASTLIGNTLLATNDFNRFTIAESASNSGMMIGQDSTHGLVSMWEYSGTPGLAKARIETYGGANPLYLQSSGGNVGVGAQAAPSLLTVTNTTGTGLGALFTGTQTGYNSLSVQNTSGASTFFMTVAGTSGLTVWGAARTDIASLEVNGTNGGFIGNRNASSLNFGTNDAVRITIGSTGNVGIGTTTPSYLLNPFSSTAPQLALSAGGGLAQWAVRNAGGNFYLSTTTVAGTATTSTSALEISGSGFGTTTVRGLNISAQATTTSNVGFNITNGCFAVNGTCVGGGGGTYGDTDVNAYIHASTTIPKLYTSNTWTNSNIFTGLLTNTYASSTYSSFTTASTTNFNIGGQTFVSLLGSGLSNSASTLTVSGLTTSNFASANISQFTNDSGYITSSGVFAWPFTAQTWGVSTSTTVGLLNGFLSTASSTIVGNATTTGSFHVGSYLSVGTSSPFAQLSVESQAGYPALVVGSSTATSFIVDKNGNVGIGTSNPLAKLSVISQDPASSQLLLDFRNAGGYGIYANTDSIFERGNTIRWQATDYNTGSPVTRDVLTFRPEGNVGIGTASPSAKLDVNGNFALTGIMTQTAGSSYNSFANEVRVDVGGGSNNALYINGDMRFGPDYGGSRTALFKYNTTFDGLLIDTWASGKEIHIGGSKVVLGVGESGQLGNVGVSTTTPTYTLNPFSSTASQLALSAGAGLNQWAFRNAGGNFYLSTTTVAGDATTTTSALEIAGSGFGTTTVRGLNISAQATTTSNVGMNITTGCYAISGTCLSTGGAGSGASTTLLADANTFSGTNNFTGKVGLASSTPWGQLSINPNALGSGVPEFVIGSSSATHLIVTGRGRVGIGTTSPTEALSVVDSGGSYEIGSGSISINSTGSTAFIELFNSSGQGLSISNSSANTTFVNDGYLAFSPGLAESARLTTDGKFGVGTTTPTSTVSLQGTAGRDVFRVATSTGANVFTISEWGGVTVTTASSTAFNVNMASGTPVFTVDTTAGSTAAGLDITASVGETANLLNLYSSGSTFLSGFTASGGLFMNISSTTAINVYDGSGNAAFVVSSSGHSAGVGTSTLTYAFTVQDSQASTYVARIDNANTGVDADGLLITLGVANASRTTSNYFVGFATGDKTVAGKIQGGASAVAYTTTAADLAEYFRASDLGDMPKPGEVVMLDASKDNSVLTADGSNTQSEPLGIISTNPGFIGNGPICLASDVECDANYAQYNALVAIAGQVPVRISLENGPIAVGDYLTLSSTTPGAAVKLVESGYIVGVAVSNATTTRFINPLPVGSSSTTPRTYENVDTVTAFIKSGWREAPGTQNSGLLAGFVEYLKSVGFEVGQNFIKITNLITDKLVAKRVETEEVCIKDICVNRDQLEALVQMSGVQSFHQDMTVGTTTPVVDTTATSTSTTSPAQATSTPITPPSPLLQQEGGEASSTPVVTEPAPTTTLEVVLEEVAQDNATSTTP